MIESKGSGAALSRQSMGTARAPRPSIACRAECGRSCS